MAFCITRPFLAFIRKMGNCISDCDKKKCKVCNQKWNPKTHYHCDTNECNCHKSYELKMRHCSDPQCHKSYNPEIETHCHNNDCNCHKNFKKNLSHCKDVSCRNREFNPRTQYHCVDNDCNCHGTFYIGHQHCVICKKNWRVGYKEHCDECHIVYKLNDRVHHCNHCHKTLKDPEHDCPKFPKSKKHDVKFPDEKNITLPIKDGECMICLDEADHIMVPCCTQTICYNDLKDLFEKQSMDNEHQIIECPICRNLITIIDLTQKLPHTKNYNHTDQESLNLIIKHDDFSPRSYTPHTILNIVSSRSSVT